MAAAIACLTATACSLDDYEQEKPFTTDPVEHPKFFACESSNAENTTTNAKAAADTIFTEDDIEWFDAHTREIRFHDETGTLFKKLKGKDGKLEFHLGENVLFEVSRFVSDLDSRVYFDLVLHYSMIGEDEGIPKYYLHDCYPPQLIDHELTKENITKNAVQWETFIHYLDNIGKLRK